MGLIKKSRYQGRHIKQENPAPKHKVQKLKNMLTIHSPSKEWLDTMMETNKKEESNI